MLGTLFAYDVDLVILYAPKAVRHLPLHNLYSNIQLRSLSNLFLTK